MASDRSEVSLASAKSGRTETSILYANSKTSESYKSAQNVDDDADDDDDENGDPNIEIYEKVHGHLVGK